MCGTGAHKPGKFVVASDRNIHVAQQAIVETIHPAMNDHLPTSMPDIANRTAAIVPSDDDVADPQYV